MTAERTNKDRIRKARRALREYFTSGDGTTTAIEDLLTDLHHLASTERLEIEEMLATARHHYDEETKAPGDRG